MSLHNLISLGGRQVPSPIQRFLETKKQNESSQLNALTRFAAQQQIQAFPQQQDLARRKAEESILTSKFTRNKPPKGDQINILIPGKEGIQPGVVNTKGQIVDPVTREHIPGAIRGPSQQEAGPPGSLTSSQLGKARDKFIDKKVQSRKFVKLSNRVMQSISKNASQLGVVGAIARLGDEVKSIAKNISSEFGVDVSTVSNNVDDYEFGSLASESAAFKTNALSLALIFASASGLGEGRALSNKDVQRAIDAIGASTNSPEQLFARMRAVQQNLQDSLQIESEERGFEFGGIPELTQTETPNNEAIQIRDDFRSGKITREQAKEKLKGLKGK